MKINIIVWLFLVSFLALSCATHQMSNTSTSNVNSVETKALSELDNEAIKQFKNFFEQYFSKCGDSYYAQTSKEIFRLKDVSFELLSKYQISEADKLEKIDWSGKVIPRGKVSKEFLLDKKLCSKWDDGSHLAFGPWGGYVSVKKEKGEWNVGNDILAPSYKGFTKVECLSLPPCLTE